MDNHLIILSLVTGAGAFILGREVLADASRRSRMARLFYFIFPTMLFILSALFGFAAPESKQQQSLEHSAYLLLYTMAMWMFLLLATAERSRDETVLILGFLHTRKFVRFI